MAIWKIGGSVQELLRQAKTRREFCIYSDPFYSGDVAINSECVCTQLAAGHIAITG